MNDYSNRSNNSYLYACVKLISKEINGKKIHYLKQYTIKQICDCIDNFIKEGKNATLFFAPYNGFCGKNIYITSDDLIKDSESIPIPYIKINNF